MDADGNNWRRVYEGHSGIAVLSPDGNKIAFTKRGIGPEEDGLWVMDVNGSGIKQIVRSEEIHCAIWASDSNRIAYTCSGAAYIVKIPDGIPQHVCGTSLYSLAWSPDGGCLAYFQDGQGLLKRSISEGSTVVLDPSVNWGDGQPAWSPDGTKIAYLKDGDIFVVNAADGSGQKNLTKDPSAFDWYPCWSPDGDKIAFNTNRDGNYEIYVMNSDGSDPMNLTKSDDDEWQPTWAQ